jgi:hypothetical protein
VRVWGVTALLSGALALAGASLLTAQAPNAGAAPQVLLTRPDGSSTDVRAQARSKLLQARAQLGQGNFEQAEAIAGEVAALNLSYVASEDSPAKIIDDLKKARNDPEALLRAARAALSRKDLDRAEKYARAAEQKAGTFTFPFWGDTPSKCLDDVQVARKQATPKGAEKKAAPKATEKKATENKDAARPAVVQASHAEPAAKEQPITSSKAHVAAYAKLAQGRKQLGLGDFDGAEKAAQEVAAMNLTFSADGDTPAKLSQDVKKGRTDPKLLMAAARAAFDRKDYDRAERNAKLADKHAGVMTFPLWSESPSDLLAKIDAARKPVA